MTRKNYFDFLPEDDLLMVGLDMVTLREKVAPADCLLGRLISRMKTVAVLSLEPLRHVV